MSNKLAEDIAAKIAELPVDLQREALEFVEALAARNTQAGQTKRPFRSVEGLLNRNLDNLEEDLAEVRREMWRNFPREEPR